MPSKRYVAFARVSSREQKEEGWSLNVQRDKLREYAAKHGGEIVQEYVVAETASKSDRRRAFKDMLAYAAANAAKLDGILVVKIDRAARNLRDFAARQALREDHGVPLIAVTQNLQDNPAGRLQAAILASMAGFFTDQQSEDVKAGQERRVRSGLFVSRAPYGYRNVRKDKRGLVEVDATDGPKVRRVFHLYANENHTLDSLSDALHREGAVYSPTQPRFPRSKLHTILTDRSYLGEVQYREAWLAGTHPPLVDRPTFDRVGVLLGNKTYRTHDMLYAGSLIVCGHCGRPITGETVQKKRKDGTVKEYVYYRCGQYNLGDHPRVRLNEAKLDGHVLGWFDRMRIEDEGIRDWFGQVLRARTRAVQREGLEQRDKLRDELRRVQQQKDRLVNLRLNDEIDAGTFTAKQGELQGRERDLQLQVEAAGRDQSEQGELAVKTFELSQRLREKWLTADQRSKRQLLEIILLNCTLDGATLVPQMRKPFDVLAEGPLISQSRGDKI